MKKKKIKRLPVERLKFTRANRFDGGERRMEITIKSSESDLGACALIASKRSRHELR